MKRMIYPILFALFCVNISFAQNLNVNWSEPIECDNKLDGFFNSFMGSNNYFTYVKYSNLAVKPKKQNHKIVIKILDKNTMKEVTSKTIVDFKNKSDKEKYDDLVYYRCAIFDNVIYMFWKKFTKESEELYVRTFDVKMKSNNELKKIYEMKKIKSSGAKQPEIFVLSNQKAGDNLIIGGELAAANGETIKVEYKLMKSDLSFIKQGQVELPVSKAGRSFDGFSSDYEYGEGSKLFIYSHIVPTKEERRDLKKAGNLLSGYYDIISCIDPLNGQLNSYTLKYNRKYIKSYKALVDKNSLRVTGFFSDLDKDPRGNDHHGLFHVMLDDKDMREVNSKFSYFTSQQLNELFAKDAQDRKDRAGIFASKQKKQSEDESIATNYKIEEIVKSPGGDLMLFGSIMYNYSVTRCSTSSNGAQSCQTSYYCQKDNITAFKIAPTGDLVWAKNLDRRKTYSRWDVYDVSVVTRGDQYYVIYGSDFQTKAEKKNRRSSKSRTQSIDRLEYAVFNGDGTATKTEETINKINMSKNEKKYVDPANISVFNNNFYIPSQRNKMKKGKGALAIATTVICFPVGIFMLMSPNIYRGTNYIGKISPR